MTQVRARVYRKGILDAENFDLADVADHLAEPNTIVWVDFCAPTGEDLQTVADELGLHELAVEDALESRQRPKIDHYADHLFVACHAMSVNSEQSGLDESEIDAFVGDRWIVTVRRSDDFDIEPVLARWDRSPDLARYGVGYLLYGLLDVVVDDYFDTIEAFDEFYDSVSDRIFSGQPLDPAQQRSWFEMRRALVRFHRHVVPLREAISGLMRREHAAVAEGLHPYFQDVYDHILLVGESTDSLRDLVSTLVETNLGLRDYRQNQIMKKVTSWAAIIAVPTLVTGYYGMNVPYPGSGETWGVIVSTVLVACCSVALYLSFKQRDWL